MSQYKYDLKLRSDQTLVYNYQKTSNKDRIHKVFLCKGIAGIIVETWVFYLDIK